MKHDIHENKFLWNSLKNITSKCQEDDSRKLNDLSGKTLSNDTIIETQRTEFDTLQEMNVYKYVRRTEARSRDKINDVRRVDSLK